MQRHLCQLIYSDNARRMDALNQHIAQIKASIKAMGISESDKDLVIKHLGETVLPKKNISVYLNHIYPMAA